MKVPMHEYATTEVKCVFLVDPEDVLSAGSFLEEDFAGLILLRVFPDEPFRSREKKLLDFSGFLVPALFEMIHALEESCEPAYFFGETSSGGGGLCQSDGLFSWKSLMKSPT
jgi:hypothetical protein